MDGGSCESANRSGWFRWAWGPEIRFASKRSCRCTARSLSDQITPLEAGLGWCVKLNKGEFIGREALAKQKEEGVPADWPGSN